MNFYRGSLALIMSAGCSSPVATTASSPGPSFNVDEDSVYSLIADGQLNANADALIQQKNMDIMEYYKNILRTATDANVEIGEAKFPSMQKTLENQRAFYQSLQKKYGTMGRYRAAMGSSKQRTISKSEFLALLHTVAKIQDKQSKGLGLDDLGDCKALQLTWSGCDIAGHAIVGNSNTAQRQQWNQRPDGKYTISKVSMKADKFRDQPTNTFTCTGPVQRTTGDCPVRWDRNYQEAERLVDNLGQAMNVCTSVVANVYAASSCQGAIDAADNVFAWGPNPASAPAAPSPASGSNTCSGSGTWCQNIGGTFSGSVNLGG